MKRSILSGLAAFAIGSLSFVAYAQSCNSQTVDDAPTSRYQANADGTATDLQTGLMWMRCAMGQTWDAGSSTCTGQATTFSWQDALQAAQTLDQGAGFAGYTDWRLANLRELMSIERYHCSNPAINLDIFPATPAQAFWSSSPLEINFNVAWTLDFGSANASDDLMQSTYAIRLVRAGAYDNKLPPATSSTAAAVVNYRH
ncbi:MAG: DUF1566 domain-containing protein [Gammaproteobacteria bacterium]